MRIDNIFGKVGWAFLVMMLSTGGVIAFMVFLTIDMLDNPFVTVINFLPHLITGAVVGGFLGGIIAHDRTKALYAALILTIIIFGFLVAIFIADYFIKDEQLMPRYGEARISGRVLLYWFIPGIVISGGTISVGMIGGELSARYITVHRAKKKPSLLAPKKGILARFKQPIFVIIFILSWTPLLVPLFTFSDNVNKDFSAWNINDSGTSKFRAYIRDAGYTNISSCITSYSLLSRIEGPFVLIALAPNRFYNPVSDVPFMLKFMKNRGSMLIAHEQGSTTWLMYDMFGASLPLMASGEISQPFPMMFFADGILKDNVSYYKTNRQPVILPSYMGTHPIVQGVDSIVLNDAGGLMMIPGMADAFGWEIVAHATDKFSWVDKNEPGYPNGNGTYEREHDYYDPPIFMTLALEEYGISIEGGIPQGGFAIPVIAATEYGNTSNPDETGRVVVTTDASIFSNELIDNPLFDNKQFALNTIEWLTKGNKSMPIIFDEAHIRNPGQDVSPSAVYGQFLDYVGYMSSNWIIAPFYPFVALGSIKKWLPLSEKAKQKKMLKKARKLLKKLTRQQRKARRKRRGLGKIDYGKAALGIEGKKERKVEGILKKGSYFIEKLRYFQEQREYNKALELLYNRVKRLVAKKVHPEADADTIIHAILDKYPEADHKELMQFFKTMGRILAKGSKRLKITREETFEEIYFRMVTVQQYLEGL